MNESLEKKTDGGGLFAGTVLILVGAIFLVDRLHVADFDDVARSWWPMIIVLFGVYRLFRCGHRSSGIWLIAIGGWLQAVQMHLFGVTLHNSWPILLIILGAGLTLGAIGDAVRPRPNGDSHEA